MKFYNKSKWKSAALLCLDDIVSIENTLGFQFKSTALKELKIAMANGHGQLEYRLAGGCTGKYISQGSYDDVLFQCKKNAVSYIINDLETVDGFFSHLASDISNTCMCNVSLKAFISVRNSKKSPLHYDYHHLLNMQILGSKYWRIFRRPENIIYPSTGYVISNETDKHDEFTGEISYGDLFTIPKGFAHDVYTTSDVSVHITVILRYKTIKDILLQKCSDNLSVYDEYPLLKIIDSHHELEHKFVDLPPVNISISRDDIYRSIFSFQKLVPKASYNNEFKYNTLYFNKCTWGYEVLDDMIELTLPTAVHRHIEIEPISFLPAKLSLPLELLPTIKFIFNNGYLSFSDLNQTFDEKTSQAIYKVFFDTGIAFNIIDSE
ncbi:JmjC domain-containing protein [Aliivibrio sifiae]|uniref:JmjC domain-containing protein n=1 Tax=Aliivibrio sifiae TaxID=566293 RepID=UPI00076AC9A5